MHEKMANKMKENPRPGVVRNTVGGVNLYKDIRIDYSSDQELVYHVHVRLASMKIPAKNLSMSIF
jgi:hypothetical protein